MGMTGIIEKLLESVTSSYIPRLTHLRANEFAVIRGKVRSSPEEVEL